MTTKLAVMGPSGRMGRAVLAAAAGEPELVVHSAVDRADAPGVGQEVVAGVRTTTDLAAAIADCDVYIDFTASSATTEAARLAMAHRRAAVIGTTGLDAAAEAAIDQLARVAPVVVAANFSIGVNLLLSLVRSAAAALRTWDAEVVEVHHRDKRDAPSGTALAIASAVADARGAELDKAGRFGRAGDVGRRPPGEIGVAAVRGGDVVGEHTLFLIGDGERIEISHRATNRAIFAGGALRAAAWSVGRAPGRYGMADVLGV